MDKMKQIIENGLPNAWKDEMTIQGFKPYEDHVTTEQIIKFCERLEFTEDLYKGVRASNNKGTSPTLLRRRATPTTLRKSRRNPQDEETRTTETANAIAIATANSMGLTPVTTLGSARC